MRFIRAASDYLKLLLAAVFLFPILMIILNSFQWENSVSLIQYVNLLKPNSAFWIFLKNSIILTVPTIVAQLVIALPAAYAFARLRGKAVQGIFYLYIVTMMMPYIVTMVPNYLIADRLGILGSFSAVILPGAFGTFGVFLLKQAIQTIPSSLYDAAEIEGASQWQILIRIVLPFIKSNLCALILLLFIDHWNAIEQPLILLQDAGKFPLSIFMDTTVDTITKNAFAAAFLTMLLPLAVFLLLHKHLKSGIGKMLGM